MRLVLPYDLLPLRPWHIKVHMQTVTTSWRAIMPVRLQQAEDISYTLYSEIGVCIEKTCLYSLEHAQLYYTILVFINYHNDYGDISTVLCVEKLSVTF